MNGIAEAAGAYILPLDADFLLRCHSCRAKVGAQGQGKNQEAERNP